MSYEYLLFDLAVLIGPLVLGFFGPTYFRGRSARAWLSVFLAAIPFIIWDALVAGEHWYFSAQYTLGVEFLGLPLEEWLFFGTWLAHTVAAPSPTTSGTTAMTEATI